MGKIRLAAALAVALSIGGGMAAGPAFATSTTGTVQGTLTDPNGHPAGSVCVQLQPPGGGYGYFATTSSSGNYQMTGVTPGTWTLEFASCGGPYAPEWYSGSFTSAGATPITVTAGGVTTADQQLSAGGVITGVVTDTTSHPLAGICVSAFDTGPSGWSSGTQSTAANGSFTFLGAPQSSAVQVSVNQCNQQSATPTPGDLYSAASSQLSTSPGTTTNIGTTQLSPAGYIAGKVVDANGKPVAYAGIQASGPSAGSASADSGGNFLVGQLLGGSYTLTIQGCYGCNLVTQTASAAVTAGQGTSVPTVTLATGYAIQGTVTDSQGNPLQNICVDASPSTTNPTYESDQTDFAGDYTVAGLAPGTTYYLSFFDCSGQGYTSYSYPNPVGSGATAGQYLTGYNATLHQLKVTYPATMAAGKPASVSGSGYSAGETVTLYLGGQLLKTTPATVTASSSGTWKASVKVPATTGGAHTLQVTGSASGSVYESVQVVASLRFSPAKPAAGATVTGVVEGLYPGESVTLHQGSATGPTLGSAANANASGTADVKFTAPASGTYTIYAVGNEGSSAKATLTVS